jgi:C1A family cysteine protease
LPGSTRNLIENGREGRLLQAISIKTDSKTQTNSTQEQLNSLKTQAKQEAVLIDWSPYSGTVRYQGFCGACYAFSTVDTVSAHLAINRFGFFYQLSVQQVIDCTDNGLTFGCRGGYLEGALTQIQMKGIVSETAYPFTSGSKGFEGNCKVQTGSFKVKSFSTIQEGDCPAIIQELKRGPVSAGISGYNLRFYDSGVFNECQTADQLDHAIMIVGYTSGKGWLIKNSWGVDWG